jgi:hypothetical protein
MYCAPSLLPLVEHRTWPITNEQVVKNIACNIVKSGRSDAFTKPEHLVLNEKQGSEKRQKAIRKAISILRKYTGFGI